MQRRHIYRVVLISLIITCFTLYGCDNTTGKADIKEAALTAYLTSNYENRYSTLLEQAVTTPPDHLSGESAMYSSDDLEAPLRAYNACIQPYVSKALLDTMMANRALSRIDTLAVERSADIYPAEFVFKKYAKEGDKTTYTFTADMRIESADASSNGTINGQITVQKNGDTSIISDIVISKYNI